MQRIIVACGALGALAMTYPVRATAQQLDMRNGTWRGWLLQPDQDSMPVSYAVSHDAKHLLITLRGRSGVIYDMSDATVREIGRASCRERVCNGV